MLRLDIKKYKNTSEYLEHIGFGTKDLISKIEYTFHQFVERNNKKYNYVEGVLRLSNYLTEYSLLENNGRFYNPHNIMTNNDHFTPIITIPYHERNNVAVGTKGILPIFSHKKADIKKMHKIALESGLMQDLVYGVCLYDENYVKAQEYMLGSKLINEIDSFITNSQIDDNYWYCMADYIYSMIGIYQNKYEIKIANSNLKEALKVINELPISEIEAFKYRSYIKGLTKVHIS